MKRSHRNLDGCGYGSNGPEGLGLLGHFFVPTILETRFFGNLEVLVLAKRRLFKGLKTGFLLQDMAFHLLIHRIRITLAGYMP